MWLFTENGFVSTVQDTNNSDGLVVRARDRKSLDALSKMTGAPIVELEARDYAYRVFVARSDFAKWVQEQVDNLDYDNYKDRAAKVHGHGSRFVEALSEVWWIMNLYQMSTARSAKKGRRAQAGA